MGHCEPPPRKRNDTGNRLPGRTVKQLEKAFATPVADATPPVDSRPPAQAAKLPVIQPLTDVTAMELPGDLELLRHCASVRPALHHMDDQEDDVRAAYPFCWTHLEGLGLTWEQVTPLLPAQLVSADKPEPEQTVPRRVLGALRRRLDSLATLWEVKHAMLSTETEVTAAANSVITSVMDQAKRLDSRKRVNAQLNKED